MRAVVGVAVYAALTVVCLAWLGAWSFPLLVGLQLALGVVLASWWAVVAPFAAIALGVAAAPVDPDSDIDKVGGLLLAEIFLAPSAAVLVVVAVGATKLVRRRRGA